MKIVLLQDVKPLGKASMLVEVPEGYTRNSLLLKEFDATVTVENLSALELKQADEAKIMMEQLTEVRAFTAKIEAGSVTVHIKGGENGKTYGSVSTKELVEAVKEQLSSELGKKGIALTEPIKNFGGYETVVKLHRDVQATLRANVTEAR